MTSEFAFLCVTDGFPIDSEVRIPEDIELGYPSWLIENGPGPA